MILEKLECKFTSLHNLRQEVRGLSHTQHSSCQCELVELAQDCRQAGLLHLRHDFQVHQGCPPHLAQVHMAVKTEPLDHVGRLQVVEHCHRLLTCGL